MATAQDSQQIEIVGRNHLVNQLLLDGVEVARPERDRGVDLVAYIDLDETGGGFVACPIQMKARTSRSFGIHRKYEKFSRLLITFVWNVGGSDTEVYALTHGESVAIGETMGWTQTASWINKGAYDNNQPGAQLCALLEPHRMSPGMWKQVIRDVATGARI